MEVFCFPLKSPIFGSPDATDAYAPGGLSSMTTPETPRRSNFFTVKAKIWGLGIESLGVYFR